MTTKMNTLTARRPLWACVALVMTLLLAVPAAFADTYYSSSNGNYTGNYVPPSSGNYSGNSGNWGGHWSKPTPAPTVNYSSPGRRYYYTTGYRSGNGGFGWLNYRRGEDDNNGYTGSNAGNNTPHRADWEAKLRAQRQWDEKQYAKMQDNSGRGARCGLSGAPAYCYRLMGPYPTELKVVRY